MGDITRIRAVPAPGRVTGNGTFDAITELGESFVNLAYTTPEGVTRARFAPGAPASGTGATDATVGQRPQPQSETKITHQRWRSPTKATEADLHTVNDQGSRWLESSGCRYLG